MPTRRRDELDQRLRATAKTNVLEALHKAHEFELPSGLVQQEAQALQADTMRQMGQDDPTKAPAIAGAAREFHQDGRLTNERYAATLTTLMEKLAALAG